MLPGIMTPRDEAQKAAADEQIKIITDWAKSSTGRNIIGGIAKEAVQ
jgi:hypothetical protein